MIGVAVGVSGVTVIIGVTVPAGVGGTGVSAAVSVGVGGIDVLVGGTGVSVGDGGTGVLVAVLVGGTGVSVTVSVGVAVGGAAQIAETTLESNVTAPLRARVLPLTLAPVFRVMLVSARILPSNIVPVPSVAELPTCQNTLQVSPLIRRTDALLAVVSVLPTLKTKTASGSP